MGLTARLREKAAALKERASDRDRRKDLKKVGKAGAAGAAKQAKNIGKSAARQAAERAPDPNIDATVGRDRRRKSQTEVIGERVQRAGEARAPVDAGLHLTGSPRSIEAFAASGMEVDAGGLEGDSPPVSPGVGGGQMGLQNDSFGLGAGMDARRTGEDYEYGPDERPPDPMDSETDQQLLFAHSLLHSWVSGEPDNPGVDEDETDWTEKQVEAEHDRLAAEMEARGHDHDTPIGDVDGDGEPRGGSGPFGFADPFGLSGGSEDTREWF